MKTNYNIMAKVLGEDILRENSEAVATISEIVTRLMSLGMVNVERVATEYGCTRGNLNRKVKARTGLTLQQLVVAIQLNHAARLLLSQHELMKHEIASLSGFESPSSFSRAFKRVVGMSPTEYVEQNKQNR